MERPYRNKIAQDFLSLVVQVGITPTPIGQAVQQANVDSLFTSIVFSLRVAAANTVWIGGQNISATQFNGLELVQGAPVAWNLKNERQLYEVQGPLVDNFCQTADGIPFVAWDISRIFAVATAPTALGVILFKEMFV